MKRTTWSFLLQATFLLLLAPVMASGEELITRDQILENAYLSCAVEFRTDGDNVYASSQITGATCVYASPGWTTRLPYAWYGHDDIYEFLKKMMDGRGAGDVDTSSGQPYTKGLVGGVECSGYVGECWKIPGRTFTNDLARDSLAAPVPWTALAPGDILNNPGRHVRLVEVYPYNSNYDKVKVFESTKGTGSGLANGVVRRVLPDDYNTNFKSGYVPRRYTKVSSKPSIVSVLKAGEGQVEIKWLGDVGDDGTHAQSGFRVYQSVDGTAWTMPQGQSESQLRLVNQSTIISGLSPGTMYFFKITSMKSGQESGCSKVYAIRFDSGRKPGVLIVDGFDKWFFKAENPANRNHDFVLSYARELSRLGIGFETVDNLVVTRSNDPQNRFLLQDYRAILYLLGDEGQAGLSRDYSLTILEQLALADYLRNGGQLFLSGSQLSEDLNDMYSKLDNIRMNDAEFYGGYLKVAGSSGDAKTHAVASGSGIFRNMESFTFDDGSRYYNVSAPDVIPPGPGAVTCLSYAGGASAGIQYQGTFGSGTVAGRTVYLGFPFESIVEQDARTAIMTAVMQYFGLSSTQK